MRFNRFTGVILLVIISLNSGYSSDNQSKKYYISPKGNDSYSGLTKETAWKSLERVNREKFRPGDTIQFEAGGIWNGRLRPLGSGERGRRITIQSYGKGSRPVIHIGENAGAGITLIGQSWWEIRGIEITGGMPPQLGVRREGISVKAERGDSIAGITVRDCYIHDLWGQVGGSASSTMIEISRAAEDVLVENNTIKRCDKIGIQITGRKNIIVRRNLLENIGGDAIIVHGAYRGIIEYNVADQTCLRTGDPHLDTGKESRYAWWPHTAAIWMSHAKETLMQFNEVYHTGRQTGNGDGQAYDFDFGCENCILQYNYSRNNAGFLLIMDNTSGNVARYNISENDIKFRPTQLVTMFCDTTAQNLVHNNVFYIDHGTSDITYYYGDEYGPNKGKGKRDKEKLGVRFRNNIFYATGQGRFRTVYALGDSLNSAEFRKLEDFHKLPPPKNGTRFYNNLYFGPWMNGLPDDPKKILADPMFVSPGSGRYGLSSLDGYKLKPGSPCFNRAVLVEGETILRDFYGNPVKSYPTSVGAYEREVEAQACAFSLTATSEGQIRIDSIVSETLHVTRKYTVYLPESYIKVPDKKYPVLYLLHGHSHSNNDWVTDGKIQEVADFLKDENKACEMIIIMPDAGSIRNGYFDMKGWNYETFFFEEFVPFVEKKYRITGDKSTRAIAGFSMGGGGAVAYALEHPDMFSSVYAMSALMTLPKQDRTTLPKQDSTPVADPQMIEFGRSVLANDCIVRISFSDDASLEKYRTIRWFLDCGDDDFLLDVNFRFYQEMQRAKVPCELRVRDGNHNWEYWQSALYMALSFISDGFGK